MNFLTNQRLRMELSEPAIQPYLPIQGVSPYTSYHYSINPLSIFLLITITYSIPSTIILFRLIIFHLQTKKLGVIFNAFVQMQLLITLHGLSDFLAIRIPSTGLITRYCADKDPQLILRLISLSFYGTSHSCQLLTAMFCIMRVVILYCQVFVREKCESWFNTCSLITILISFLFALPQFLSEAVCLQLDHPFPFGSLVILSMFHYGNLISFNFTYFLFTSIIMLAILISSYLMFRKLGERRKLSVIAKSSYNMKAEKTLSVTIILILIPLVFNQVMAIGEILNHPLLSYLVLIRPVIEDWRIHIVTLYFFYTHPALKKPKIAVIKSTM